MTILQKIFFLIILIPVFLFSAPVPWGQGLSKAEDLQFKLVTFGPGDDISSYWCHTAIIVEDTHFQQSKIYNFGLFSFGDDFIYNFLKGHMIFSVGAGNVAPYFSYYMSENREIRTIDLNIPKHNRIKLAAKLAWNVLPENKNYVYDHYWDNCSTRLRDLLDEAVDGQLFEATNKPARMTLRHQTRRYIGRDPFLEMLLMFLMNDDIDKHNRQWDDMFLPDELEAQIRNLQYRDSSGTVYQVAANPVVIFKPEREPTPAAPLTHWPGALISGIALSITGYLLRRWQLQKNTFGPRTINGLYNLCLGLLLGIPGLALSFFASFTEHSVTYHNENLLLANPLSFLIIFAGGALIMNTKMLQNG